MCNVHVWTMVRNYFMQVNFQAVLVTDGTISFTLFIYDSLDQYSRIPGFRTKFIVGFDEGNARGFYVLTAREFSPTSEFVFRSDGMKDILYLGQ